MTFYWLQTGTGMQTNYKVSQNGGGNGMVQIVIDMMKNSQVIFTSGTSINLLCYQGPMIMMNGWKIQSEMIRMRFNI